MIRNPALDAQIDQWRAALAALRAGDTDLIVDALAPVQDNNRPPCAMYHHTVGLILVGASLAAVEAASYHGYIVGTRNVVWRDPSPEVEMSGTERVAIACVVDAMNHRFDQLSDRLAAYAGHDEPGTARIADLAVTVLRLHAGFCDANEGRLS